MKRQSIAWSVKQVSTMVKKQTIVFDNPLQRMSGQWNVKDKALLIHSILTLFLPDIYVVKHKQESDDKTINIYDVIDGLQRLTIIEEYRADLFSLSEFEPVLLETGETYEISNKKYSELHEDVREAIDGFMISFRVIEIEDGDDEEEIVAEIFYRLNNGSQMSSSHLAFVAAEKNVQDFIFDTLKKHPLFLNTAHFPEGSVKKSERQMTIMQSIVLVGGYDWNTFGTKDIEKVFTSNEIEQEVLDKVAAAFTIIANTFTDKSKFVSKVNIPSMVNLIVKNNFEERVPAFLVHYSKESKKGDNYRRYCGAGSTKKDQVRGRNNALQRYYEEYQMKHQSTVTTPIEEAVEGSGGIVNVKQDEENATTIH